MVFKKRFQKDFFTHSKLSDILYNRFVLFFIVFLSFINMASYGLQNDFVTPLIFILTSIVTFQYNNNMLIVFTVALIVSNLVKLGSKLSLQEGMTGEKNSNKNKMNEEQSSQEEGEEEGKVEEEEGTDGIPSFIQDPAKSTTTKSAPTKPAPTKPAPTKPASTKPASTKPAPVKPASSKSNNDFNAEPFSGSMEVPNMSALRDTIKETKELMMQFKELKEDFKNIN
jgi:hypothetical protein